jgi:large subunit ribosomal protein L15
MPLQRRVPKFGFKNFNRVEFVPFNLDRISTIAEKFNLDVISPETLYANHIIGKNDLVKVLGNGELAKGLEVHAHAFSKSALSAIEEKGGKAVNL